MIEPMIITITAMGQTKRDLTAPARVRGNHLERRAEKVLVER